MDERLGSGTGISLEGLHSYSSRKCCLQIVWREMARLGITEKDLPAHQRELMDDLWSPLDEQALATLISRWDWNLQSLERRSAKGAAARPRIDVRLETTVKGALRAEWFPRGWGPRGSIGKDASRNDTPVSFRRCDAHELPSNELLLIRRAVRAASFISRPPAVPLHELTRPLDQPLLLACTRAVEELMERLELHFEVRALQRIEMTWTDGAGGGERHKPQIMGWKVVPNGPGADVLQFPRRTPRN